MPRFFFDLHNDIDVEDEEGQQLADVETAIAQAAMFAREMAAESVRKGLLDRTHSIEVRNEAGKSLCRVTFGEAVQIVG